jgi:hypothetical protein
LWSGDFVEQILQLNEETCCQQPQSLDHIMARVLTLLEIPQTELLSRKRSLSLADARGIICHRAFLSGHRGIDLARKLDISGSGVTVAARRGKELVEKSPQLKAIVD